MTKTEKPTTFKYKVRGPPWAQRIVKVPVQKPEAAKEPVKISVAEPAVAEPAVARPAVAEPADDPITLTSKNS